MRINRSGHALTGAVLSFALLATACGSDTTTAGSDTTTSETDGAMGAGLSGNIDISGSSTVEPISNAVKDDFNADNPDVAISVSGPGTGDGFAVFCTGETDISDASRPIKDSEAEDCTTNGIEYTELRIGIDGIAVITSRANDTVDCVDFAAIYGLVGPESTGFGNWSDAATIAGDLGSTTELPDADLSVVAPGEESGTYDSFVELVLEGFADERGQAAEARPDYDASPNDNVIVEGIEGSDTAFGWVGYAFYDAEQDRLKALAVDDGESGCVDPTPETIASGDYPLSRPLFIYVNNESYTTKPEVAAYVDFYVNDGIDNVTEVGYVALDDASLQELRDAAGSIG